MRRAIWPYRRLKNSTPRVRIWDEGVLYVSCGRLVGDEVEGWSSSEGGVQVFSEKSALMVYCFPLVSHSCALETRTIT